MIYDCANSYSQYNMSHLCAWAGDKNRLDLWKNVPVKAVNWAVFIEEMSLSEGREFFGGKTCVGGFDNRPQGILNTGTKEEIEAEVKRLVEASSKRGYIIGPDCSIHDELPEERIKWIVDAARKL